MPIGFETDTEWVCSIVRMKMSPMSPQNHQIHTLAWNSNAFDGNGMHHGHDRCHLHSPPLILHAINTALFSPSTPKHAHSVYYPTPPNLLSTSRAGENERVVKWKRGSSLDSFSAAISNTNSLFQTEITPITSRYLDFTLMKPSTSPILPMRSSEILHSNTNATTRVS